MNTPIITLTTDFGTSDPYVGIMKGMILAVCPTARIVDLSHDVGAFNTAQAAFVVAQAVPYFPRGTVHMVVVDPGVGGPRRALIAKGNRASYVGPDNGVLGPLFHEDGPVTVHEIGKPDFLPRKRSTTFHGRDLFAPAAAHLLTGRNLADFGPKVSDDLALPFPTPTRTGDGWAGEIVHVDRFGNLISNLPGEIARQLARVTVGSRTVPVVSRYGDVAVGKAGALAGSSGRVEIFVREHSAKTHLGATVGDGVSGQIGP